MKCTHVGRSAPALRKWNYKMRPETLAIVNEIKQSLSLMRRYL